MLVIKQEGRFHFEAIAILFPEDYLVTVLEAKLLKLLAQWAALIIQNEIKFVARRVLKARFYPKNSRSSEMQTIDQSPAPTQSKVSCSFFSKKECLPYAF